MNPCCCGICCCSDGTPLSYSLTLAGFADSFPPEFDDYCGMACHTFDDLNDTWSINEPIDDCNYSKEIYTGCCHYYSTIGAAWYDCIVIVVVTVTRGTLTDYLGGDPMATFCGTEVKIEAFWDVIDSTEFETCDPADGGIGGYGYQASIYRKYYTGDCCDEVHTLDLYDEDFADLLYIAPGSVDIAGVC